MPNGARLPRNWSAEAAQENRSAHAPRCRGRDRERSQRRLAQVLAEHARARPAHDVEGARHRVGRDRQPRGHGLEQDEAERVGPAGKDERVGRGVGLGERLAEPGAEEHRLGVRLCRVRDSRPVADHQLRPRQIEAEERHDVLLDRDPADVEEDRARRP
jgi:hypothetical protein